jgi:hypothetical protein
MYPDIFMTVSDRVTAARVFDGRGGRAYGPVTLPLTVTPLTQNREGEGRA